ncbi:MAG TPA: hypothetical protein VE172_14905 [Stackebrandtia sp.]|nr:hypothetical protein [Stackebrandtia sp.]HZE40094.1 hypothetical protein [Stackebrandtia sp.]
MGAHHQGVVLVDLAGGVGGHEHEAVAAEAVFGVAGGGDNGGEALRRQGLFAVAQAFGGPHFGLLHGLAGGHVVLHDVAHPHEVLGVLVGAGADPGDEVVSRAVVAQRIQPWRRDGQLQHQAVLAVPAGKAVPQRETGTGVFVERAAPWHVHLGVVDGAAVLGGEALPEREQRTAVAPAAVLGRDGQRPVGQVAVLPQRQVEPQRPRQGVAVEGAEHPAQRGGLRVAQGGTHLLVGEHQRRGALGDRPGAAGPVPGAQRVLVVRVDLADVGHGGSFAGRGVGAANAISRRGAAHGSFAVHERRSWKTPEHERVDLHNRGGRS